MSTLHPLARRLGFGVLLAIVAVTASEGTAVSPGEADCAKGSDEKAAAIQRVFEEWKAEYYEEQGPLARVKFDDHAFTVSEGIGYGMLIFVAMDGPGNDTRDEFDRLWNYYHKFSDWYGFMHWKIEGFERPVGRHGATDSELDVAVALLMAAERWSDGPYLRNAISLIQRMYRYEVNRRGFLKPGNDWDRMKNPSYLSLAALELFKKVDTLNDWQRVIETSYGLLESSRHAETGLWPDWCGEDGVAIGGGKEHFSYDAVRTPWRLAWNYAWNRDERSLALLERFNRWVESEGGPAGVMSGYTLAGQARAKTTNACFVGAAACAIAVENPSPEKTDAAFQATLAARAPAYFSKTLQVLYLLLIAGEFPSPEG